MGTATGAVRALVLACLVTALAVTVGVVVAPGARDERARGPAPPASSGRGHVVVERPAAVAAAALRAWDERRAAAWAEGDVRALRGLYAVGSRAGRADVRMLRAWLGRGLRVRGLATQFLGVEVVEDAPERIVVRVKERVVRAAAVGAGVRRRLEQPAPATRVVELVRVAGDWRVGSVSPVPG